MKSMIEAHFEVLILVFIFVFASGMLALFPMREELARWIENGAIITIIARGMGAKAPIPPNTTNKTIVMETTNPAPEKNDPQGEPIP